MHEIGLLTAMPMKTIMYAPINPYPMLAVCAVSASWEKLTALSIRNGWQKLKAIRHSLGGTTASMGHFNFLNVVPKRECVPTFATISPGLVNSRYRGRVIIVYLLPTTSQLDGAGSLL